MDGVSNAMQDGNLIEAAVVSLTVKLDILFLILQQLEKSAINVKMGLILSPTDAAQYGAANNHLNNALLST
jgi:hypothetical protein